MFRIEKTRCLAAYKMPVAPLHGSRDCLGRKSLAVRARNQCPANFRNSIQRWIDIPLVIGKADLPQKLASVPVFDDPIAKPQRLPMTNISQ